MRRGTKVTLAGTVTWIAAITSYNAIFEWTRWPWERYGEPEIVLLCLLPPLVAVLAFLLFRWAMGEAFVDWFKGSRSRLTSLIIGALLVLSVFNSWSAATNAEDAYYMANSANDAANSANDAAETAASYCSR